MKRYMGEIDAWMFLAGALAGSSLYHDLHPRLAPLHSPVLGIRFIHDDLGIPRSLFVILLTGVAVAAFWLAELVERRVANGGRYWRSHFLAAFSLLLLAIAATGFLFTAGPTRDASPGKDVAMLARIERAEDHMEPEELARRLVSGDPDLVVIDVRPVDEFARFHLRGAVRLDLPALPVALEPFREGKDIVLYSNGMTHPAQARDGLERAGFARVFILTGGLTGFVERCLKPISLRDVLPDEDAASEIRAWREYFLAGSGTRRTHEP